MDAFVRVPVREQEPKVRATNFEEVCYGYNEEEAVAEASRCLNCKNAQCMKAAPVSINIPAFIAQVKERNFLLYVAVYVHRRASVKANVSAESRARQLLSVNLSVSLLTGLERTASSQRKQKS